MKKTKLPRNQNAKLKTAKGRKISSQLWLNRQINDPYVFAAKKEGYRSRAAYKLIEINQKFNFLRPGLTVIDLGSAPGSWSQVLSKKLKSAKNGMVIAVDIQSMEPVKDVDFILGDFTEESVQSTIEKKLDNQKADIILSDMAPSATGHAATDHLRIIALVEVALEFCMNNLKKDGKFIIKILKGSEEKQYIDKLKKHFKVVKYIKPGSSREDSREEFIYAGGFLKN